MSTRAPEGVRRQQASGVSYLAPCCRRHRAVGRQLSLYYCHCLHRRAQCKACGKGMASIGSAGGRWWEVPGGRHQVCQLACHRALSGGSYRAVVLSGGSSHQRRPAGISVSYRAMHRAIGALMRPCAGRLHRRRTAGAVSRMHVRGGAGAVCRNGINRAAVGVSYQAPVIPPAVGRELVCCWVGLRASAHLARAVYWYI